MVDLSAYKCPHCGCTWNNHAVGNKAICGTCGIVVEGPHPDDERLTGAANFIRLSEAVHGKPHDGPTVDVRIAVAVDQTGEWDAMKIKVGDNGEAEKEVTKWLYGKRVCHIVTATLPLPVAQEAKGRVEG